MSPPVLPILTVSAVPYHGGCLSNTLQAKVSVTPISPTHSYHHTPIIFFWSKLPRVLAVTQQNVWTRLSSFTDVQLLSSLWGRSTARLRDKG